MDLMNLKEYDIYHAMAKDVADDYFKRLPKKANEKYDKMNKEQQEAYYSYIEIRAFRYFADLTHKKYKKYMNWDQSKSDEYDIVVKNYETYFVDNAFDKSVERVEKRVEKGMRKSLNVFHRMMERFSDDDETTVATSGSNKRKVAASTVSYEKTVVNHPNVQAARNQLTPEARKIADKVLAKVPKTQEESDDAYAERHKLGYGDRMRLGIVDGMSWISTNVFGD